jgi:hypothetical protein
MAAAGALVAYSPWPREAFGSINMVRGCGSARTRIRQAKRAGTPLEMSNP